MKKRIVMLLFIMTFVMGAITVQVHAAEFGEEMYVEGDEGLSDEELEFIMEGDPKTAMADVSDVSDRSAEMVRLAIEYDQSIPFVHNKRELVEEYFPYKPFRPIDRTRTDFGMGYLGYIQWLYLNSFGYIPECLWDERAMLGNPEVNIEELQTGDIGIYYDKENDSYRYGVYIGINDGKHVFTFQSPEGNLGLFTGCNRIAYLASETEEYFCKTKPVLFTKFVRPDVTWNIEEDTYTVPAMEY